MTAWGKLSAGGDEYQITDEDVLWLARMCEGEGEHNYAAARALVSCMLRRFVVVGMANAAHAPKPRAAWSWPSVTSLLIGSHSRTGYSQPIAFQWRTVGARHCALHPNLCEQRHINNRKRVRLMTYDQIGLAKRQGVEAACKGGTMTAPHAVEFAARALVLRKLPSRAPDWALVNGPTANQLVSITRSRSAPASFSRVISPPCRLFS